MQGLLTWAAVNSAMAAVLAAIALLSTLLRRPALTHVLWLLVLVKLVTPPVWRAPVRWPWPARSAETLQSTITEGLRIDARVATPAHAFNDIAVSRVSPARMSPGKWAMTIAGACWLMGSGLCVAIALRRVLDLRRVLKLATPAPPELEDHADRLAKRLGMRRGPGIWFVPAPIPPMLVAPLAPARLLVPQRLWRRLSDSQRDALLLHELAHLRRGDHLVRWLELLVTILYWWNPLLWASRRGLRSAEELCCDAWVTWAMPSASDDYADALIEAIEFASSSSPALPLLASGIGEFRQLHRRLLMIRNGHRSPTLGWTAIVACIAALALPLSLSRAQDESAPKSPARSEAPPEHRSATSRPVSNQAPPDAALKTKLDRQLPELAFDGVALSDVIDFLRDVSGANLFVNWKSLEAAGIDRNAPVTTRLHNIKFSKALNVILDSVGGGQTKLGYTIDDGVITISIAPAASLVLRKYDVADLLRAGDKRGEKLIKLITGSVDADSWEENGGSSGMVKLDGDKLIIVQSEANQKAVDNLLRHTREMMKAAAPIPGR